MAEIVLRSRSKTILAAVLSIIVCALVLSSCGEPERIYEYHDDDIRLNGDDTYQCELQSIPEGHDASEYTWDSTGDVSVDQNGLVTAVNNTGDGVGYAYAELQIDNTIYGERFSFLVSVTREKFAIEPAEVELVQKDLGLDLETESSERLKISMDGGLGFAEGASWKSSDTEVVHVESIGDSTEATVSAVGSGEADVTVTVGENKATCHVTVKKQPVGRKKILSFLDKRAEDKLVVSGKTAFVSSSDIGCTMKPKGEPGDGGKYMIQVDLSGDEDWYRPIDDGQLDSKKGGMPIGYYSESLTNGIGMTALLPEEYRAASMDEVSKIIRVSLGEPKKGPAYDNGVQGYLTVVNIELVDAKTGKVIKTYETLKEGLNEKYYIEPSHKEIYSLRPSERKIINSIYEVVKDLWLEKYDNVVFYDKYNTFRYYGSTDVVIPEDLGIKEMLRAHYVNETEPEPHITSFEVPADTEIGYCPGWSGYSFRVHEGSAAEKYCMDNDIQYELIK